jgi:tetratricopeptide (TPR) repeat protein
MNERPGLVLRLLPGTPVSLLLLSLTGCAGIATGNVAKAHAECLTTAGTYYQKLVACNVAIRSRQFSGSRLAKLYFMKGIHQQDAGRHDEAIASFKRALALNPADAEAYFYSGISQQKIGHLDEAQRDADAAQRLRSDPVFEQAVRTNYRARDRHALEQLEREEQAGLVQGNVSTRPVSLRD